MELDMPMNYELLNQEEMMYLDGGGIVRLTISAKFLKSFVCGSSAALAAYIAGKYLANSRVAKKAISAALISFTGAYISGHIRRDLHIKTPDIFFLPNWNLRI